MLKSLGKDTFLNRIFLIIYGIEERKMRLIDRDSFQGKKRG